MRSRVCGQGGATSGSHLLQADTPLAQVLADELGHLEHAERGLREHLVQRRVRLDGATLAELLRFDVGPQLLRHFSARHLLSTANRRQLRTQVLRSENALPCLLLRQCTPLTTSLLRLLSGPPLLHLDLVTLRLRQLLLRRL